MPEIASRAHVELLTPVVAQALVEAGVADGDIDAVAATYGPGLVGALLVGVSTAKALALVWDVPFVGVNHLEAHLYAAFLEEPDARAAGGRAARVGRPHAARRMEDHGRYRLLGSTIDDAAGEAFDKVARYLGLGYPGGPAIDRVAMEGDPSAIAFPRAMLDDGLDFSFCGPQDGRGQPRAQAPRRGHRRRGRLVPGGGRRRARRQGPPGGRRDRGQGACASAAGVAANSLLRERFLDACVRGRASTASCPAGRCAPTTRRWWPPPAGGASQSDGPSPLDAGADPNLRLPLLDCGHLAVRPADAVGAARPASGTRRLRVPAVGA